MLGKKIPENALTFQFLSKFMEVLQGFRRPDLSKRVTEWKPLFLLFLVVRDLPCYIQLPWYGILNEGTYAEIGILGRVLPKNEN